MRIPIYNVIGLIVLDCFFLFHSEIVRAQCAKYEPQDGKVLFIIGQDLNATGKTAYGAGYCDDAVLGATPPAGVTSYAGTGLASGQGITYMVDYGAGPLHADLYNSTPYFNNSVIAMGLYMVNDLGNVISGAKNPQLDALGNWIKSVSPRPVYLRIGYEFEFQYACCPAQYIQAWQYIVNRFRNVLNVTNVAYVWQAAAGNGSQAYLLQWYPGDSYVDWIGYSHFYTNSDSQCQNLLNLARTKRKPVMIAEATPFGYNLSQSTGASTAWTNYFTPLFNHINNNIDIIKAFCYINQDWDAQSLWNGQGWGNSRIQANGDGLLKNRWMTELNKSHWQHASSALFTSLQNSNTQQPFGGTAAVLPGTIQAEDFDTGCEGVSYFDNSGGNSGGSIYRYGYSVDIGPTADVSGGADVGWTASGEWLGYTVSVAVTAQYNFTFRVSTMNSGNTFHIEQDGVNVSGTVTVPNTGSWTTYTNLILNNISLTAGTHVLRIYFDNVPGFNLNYFSASTPLPVTFLNVSATLNEDQHVLLEWSTAEEKNNASFEIQRAHLNTNYFETIGTQGPSGNSNSISYYILIDAPAEHGVYYYRIKQIDTNGQFSFSEIISITLGITGSLVIASPNPFYDDITLQCDRNIGETTIIITDLSGRVVYKDTGSGRAFQFGKDLKAGMYLVLVENGKEKKIIRIQKLDQ